MFSLHYWDMSDEDPDLDPFEILGQAYAIANDCKIHISRVKDLAWVALREGACVGASWTSLFEDRDRDLWVFSCDIAVRPDSRGYGIGPRLIEQFLDDLRTHQSEHPTVAEVTVVNPKMASVLEKKYGFTVIDPGFARHTCIMRYE